MVPDDEILLYNGVIVCPMITLKNDYNGVMQVIIDDQCYCLAVKHPSGMYYFTHHWIPEAIGALTEILAKKTVDKVFNIG